MPPKSQPVGRARLFQRGNVYWLTVQHRRKQIRRSLRTRNLKEAQRLAREFEISLLQGEPAATHVREPPPIQEVTDAFLKNREAIGRARKTLAKYRGVCERLLQTAADLGREDIVQIDHAFIDEFRSRRLREVGVNTTNDDVATIRGIVLFAVRRKMISMDPLQGLQIPKRIRAPQPSWTEDEVKRILAAASAQRKPLFELLWQTGCRIGELQWLTWDDVDWQNNVIHVRPKRGWQPKTGNIRAIPMSARARAVLESLPQSASWVFTASVSKTHPDAGRQLDPRRALCSLKRVLTKLGLPGKLHSFRHSFISHCAVNGIPEAVIRQWVGQVDEDILQMYTHVASEISQRAMRQLEARSTQPDDLNEVP